MAETEIKIFEEKRYPGETPQRLDGILGIRDLQTGGPVTGIATRQGKTIIRYKHGSHVHYVYIAGEYGEPERLALDSALESGVKKSLWEFADRLEGKLDGLPVEIHITVNPPRVSAKLLRYVDKETFQRFATACKELGMKYDPPSSAWLWRPPL